MNALRKNILIGLTVLGLGASGIVSAQAPASAPVREGRHGHADKEMMQAKMGEHFAKRQARLHALLKLTSAQESAWTTYQAAIKPAARGARPDRAAMAGMPAPQRMEQMIAKAKQHTATMESHLGALTAFYAVLTPEQKKVFDEHAMRGGHGRRHMQDR